MLNQPQPTKEEVNKFFEQKEFYNDEDGSCSKVFLYKKIDEYVSVWGDTEGLEFGDDITDFCTPEELSKIKSSYTGHFLSKIF